MFSEMSSEIIWIKLYINVIKILWVNANFIENTTVYLYIFFLMPIILGHDDSKFDKAAYSKTYYSIKFWKYFQQSAT